MKERNIGDTVYLQVGMQKLELEIISITISGSQKIYGLEIIFNKGAQNETREMLCGATEDMFLTL